MLNLRFLQRGSRITDKTPSPLVDHAGPRDVASIPQAPAFVTQFWHPRSGFGARFRFCNSIHQMEKTRKQKLLEMILVMFHNFPLW